MAIAMLSGMAKASQKKAIKVSGNGMYLITPDRGRLLRSVTVEVEAPIADYDTGFEAGKQAEYDAFWDTYQQNGNRSDYANAFSGKGWTNETFRPKYDIISNQSYMLFRYCGIVGNLGDVIRATGKKVILEGNIQMAFNNTRLEIIDGVEFSGVITNLGDTFNFNSSLVEIKMPLLVGEKTANINGFNGCTNLEEVRFDGTICINGLNLQWSKKLSKASIENVISCLSTTTSGLTVTLSKTAVNKAFETGEGYADGSDSAAWSTLIATKSNWTISLV